MEDFALIAVVDAIQAIDLHLSGQRDPVLGPEYDDQIRRFRERLMLFKKAINAGKLPAVDGAMTWAIADSWPYDSTLAELIPRAENECGRFNAQRNETEPGE